MAGSGDLFVALEDFLAVCLAATEDTPAGKPDCAYLSAGPPVYDSCPCLIVWAGGPQIADTFPLQPVLGPGHRATVAGEVNLVTMTAEILRCGVVLPDDAIPGPDWQQEHRAVVEQTSADLWSIWNHLRQAKRDGTLFGPREREFFLEPAVAIHQQGGAVGWQITIRTELDGYDPNSP